MKNLVSNHKSDMHSDIKISQRKIISLHDSFSVITSQKVCTPFQKILTMMKFVKRPFFLKINTKFESISTGFIKLGINIVLN